MAISDEQIQRIKNLREFYHSQPVYTQHLSYNRVLRQRLNYMRGYIYAEQNASIRPATSKESYTKKVAYTTRLRRAYAEAYILRNMEPMISDNELIVGRPDYTPLTDNEQKEYDELMISMRGSQDTTDMTFGHMALDYPKLLKCGVNGLLAEIAQQKSSLDLNEPDNLSKYEFYEGCEIELEALLVVQKKYADKVRRLAEQSNGERQGELWRLYHVLCRVPAEPAQSFYEALQSVHFYNFNLWELYYFGRVDQYLYPYYRRDKEAGLITYDKAVELFSCFLLLPESYILPNTALDSFIAGRNSAGEPVENEVTHIALDAAELTRCGNGKLAMGICKDTSEELLRRAIRLNASGAAQPALYNVDVIAEGMINNGIDAKDAHDFANTGCTEMTPIGKSGIYPCAPYHNLARILLDAMRDKKDASDIDIIVQRFSEILRHEVFAANLIINRRQMERARNGGEPMRVSCLVSDCIKKGKSIDEGGARYNHIQPTFIGLANVVDSLKAIQTLVFEEKRLTIDNFLKILDANYVDNEALRLRIIHRIPHYGMGDSVTDAYAKQITDIIIEACKGINTYRGSILVPGTFSYTENVTHGKETPATPDGRKAGEVLAACSGGSAGREINGPTAAMLSATSWDQSPFMGGCVINMKFSKGQMSGENEDRIIALLRAFMQRSGMEVQFNCVDRDTLLAAQKDPEQYSDLLVRVRGFSAYFVKLPNSIQEEIIERNEHSFN